MYQICVSGSHNGKSVEDGKQLAIQIGEVLARAGHSLMTGATIGLPNTTAEAYKKAGGIMSVGISPAASKVEHVMKYRLPTKAYDTIVYSGMHYVGRDNLLINSSDAVMSLGGRMGTLHEFAIAVETDTPIGFVQGAGGISAEVMDILQATGESNNRRIVFGDTPEMVLELLVELLDEEHKKYKKLYS
jgi:uncharacterized protein (TIGR00725 family)